MVIHKMSEFALVCQTVLSTFSDCLHNLIKSLKALKECAIGLYCVLTSTIVMYVTTGVSS